VPQRLPSYKLTFKFDQSFWGSLQSLYRVGKVGPKGHVNYCNRGVEELWLICYKEVWKIFLMKFREVSPRLVSDNDCEKGGVFANIYLERFRGPAADVTYEIVGDALFCEKCCAACTKGLSCPCVIRKDTSEAGHEPMASWRCAKAREP
jgi:hypothetical protein